MVALPGARVLGPVRHFHPDRLVHSQPQGDAPHRRARRRARGAFRERVAQELGTRARQDGSRAFLETMAEVKKGAEVKSGAAGGYDRLRVPGPNGETQWMSRSAFENLPLTDRVRLLAGGNLRFFREDR